MIPQPSAIAGTLAAASAGEIRRTLRTGLSLDLGACSMRVRGDVGPLARHIGAVYRNFALRTGPGWTDLHVHIEHPPNWRRWLRPQAVFRCDGQLPFEPFPAANALPLLEWGANWLIGQRLNHLLLLHAGALERNGHALLMPALPGSGKSTLAAALSLRGWRLLSDEFGAWDPDAGRFRAVLKPVALKNESIAVIRRFEPAAPIGPEFPKTRKGTVAHLAADVDAVARCREGARPGAFVLPRWQAGSALRLEPVAPQTLFGVLAFNAFNYRLLGEVGFDAVLRLARGCPAWQLVYGDLDQAVAAIDSLWSGAMAATARVDPEASG